MRKGITRGSKAQSASRDALSNFSKGPAKSEAKSLLSKQNVERFNEDHDKVIKDTAQSLKSKSLVRSVFSTKSKKLGDMSVKS